jgi:sugar lactone lactonase YvrE
MSNSLVKISIIGTEAKVSHIRNNLIDDDMIAFNDGLLDMKGNLWVGTMDKTFQHDIGKLYRISPIGEVMIMDEGFVVSNGMGWSPEKTKFYFTDSITRNIYQYRFNPETSEIDQKIILIKFSEEQGFPDGLYIDKRGSIWVAGWDSHHVYEYSPQGALLKKIQFPAKNLTSCCFGGHNLKTLFVTSASFDVINNTKDPEENAGAIYYLN